MRPVEPVLEAGAQIQQMVNAECVEDYTGMLTVAPQLMSSSMIGILGRSRLMDYRLLVPLRHSGGRK